MKFKKGDWVTIIRNNGVKSFDKFIGMTFPIIEVFGNGDYGLPITPDTRHYTFGMKKALKLNEVPKIDLHPKFPSNWSDKELRKATKKEIAKAKKELCIEAL